VTWRFTESPGGAWLLLVIAALVAGPARAQDGVRAAAAVPALPADDALAHLIGETIARLPEVSRAESMIDAEEARVPQAGAWPDPMLQLGIQNDGFTSIEIGRMGTSFVSLMASQTVPWPGKLGLREEVARLDVARAQAVLVRARVSAEAEVRRTYLALILAPDRSALLEQLETVWQQSLGVARALYESGGAAQSDVLRGQLELNRIKLRRVALDADARSRVQTINRLRDHPLDDPIETSMHVRALPPLAPLESIFSATVAVGHSPELAAARVVERRSHSVESLAEKDEYPDLTVGAGFMFRGDLPPMWLLTIGAPIPVFSASKQDRAVVESQAQGIAARHDVVALEQRLRLQSAARHTAFSALLETIALYDEGLLIQSAATAESTMSQYKVGRVTFASVLEANAGFIGDQDGYLMAIAAAHAVLIAEAEMDLAGVQMPAPSTGDAGGMR